MKSLYITYIVAGVVLIVASYAFDWDAISPNLDYPMAIAGAAIAGWAWRKLSE